MQDRLDYLLSQCPEDENTFAIAEEDIKEDENDPEYQKQQKILKDKHVM